VLVNYVFVLIGNAGFAICAHMRIWDSDALAKTPSLAWIGRILGLSYRVAVAGWATEWVRRPSLQPSSRVLICSVLLDQLPWMGFEKCLANPLRIGVVG